jgi:hypothetical protein
MKKRVEAELISIAHRILKLKNKSEVDQLYKETQKLYETLSVLKFYQDHYEILKSEVDTNELEEKLEIALDTQTPQTPIPAVLEDAEGNTETPTVEEETITEEAQEEPVVTEAEKETEIIVEEEVTETAPEVAAVPTTTEAPLFTPIFELAEEESEEETPASETLSDPKPETKHVALEDLLG